MPRFAHLLAVAALVGASAGGTAAAKGSGKQGCAERHATPGQARAVERVLRSGPDVWGNRLLHAPGGPTYDAAKRLLPPLLYARTSSQRPLTASGVYYLPFAQPGGPQGAGTVLLHLADGSQILAEQVGGPHLDVSAGGERYGSCLARLTPARLADGYLPILRTAYRDAHGGRHTQESFAALGPDGRLAAYVHLTGGARLSTAGSALAGREVYARWTHGRPIAAIDAGEYARARATIAAYWNARLAEGASLVVPERRVLNAERAVLIQNLMLTWRYSIGNPYEEFSFPESVDGAQVLDEYGFAAVARSMLRTSLTRRPEPYANWKRGEKLVGSALHWRLSRDRGYLDAATPTLRGYVDALARQVAREPRGLLARERYSSDIPDSVLGLHAQAVAWQGLRAIADAWAESGRPELAARARATAARLERGLRGAVRASQRRLPDGSLFLPVRLLDREPAYGALTASRAGSYWNLVAPYALASGLFAPESLEARGSLRYLLLHGSRLVGLVRAGAFSIYGPPSYPASGTDQVYGLNVARFLADLDEADQLVLSLYGQLAMGMTPETFVAGEAASVAPIGDTYGRAMYLPPNSVSNDAFLETLRTTLVHETRTRGLELAFATPRGWLAPGKRIEVRAAATSFGPLSYSLVSATSTVAVSVDVPARVAPRSLRLRLRLPRGARVVGATLGGKPFARVDRRSGTLDLSGLAGTVELEVRVAR